MLCGARMKHMAPGDARPEWAIAWLIGGYAPREGRGTEAAERLSTGQSAGRSAAKRFARYFKDLGRPGRVCQGAGIFKRFRRPIS
jgi:hypothetical protein